MNGGPLTVQVACALRHRQALIETVVSPGDRVIDAVRHSGILEQFPELDPAALSYSIHGVCVPEDAIVRPGDRVELLRALCVDPKEARRLRARKAP